ncbi:hypothetical protein PM082_021903 [Marasmius tenuissimus]|nr:hypothetical protein PM082_021903 [Marasmius tenuissimus]
MSQPQLLSNNLHPYFVDSTNPIVETTHNGVPCCDPPQLQSGDWSPVQTLHGYISPHQETPNIRDSQTPSAPGVGKAATVDTRQSWHCPNPFCRRVYQSQQALEYHLKGAKNTCPFGDINSTTMIDFLMTELRLEDLQNLLHLVQHRCWYLSFTYGQQ